MMRKEIRKGLNICNFRCFFFKEMVSFPPHLLLHEDLIPFKPVPFFQHPPDCNHETEGYSCFINVYHITVKPSHVSSTHFQAISNFKSLLVHFHFDPSHLTSHPQPRPSPAPQTPFPPKTPPPSPPSDSP